MLRLALRDYLASTASYPAFTLPALFRMRPSFVATRFCAIALAIGLCQHSASRGGDESKPALPAQLHPWGTFQPGAWKQVRIITESGSAETGDLAVTNVVESTTILDEVGSESVCLEMQSSVEMSGKQYDVDPQIVQQSFFCEPLSTSLKTKDPVPVQIKIEDRSVNCLLYEYSSATPTSKTTTKAYFSQAVAPHVLRRESVTSDLDGKKTLSETTFEVIAFDMPCKVLGVTRSAVYSKTTQKNPKGTVVTIAVLCPEVPGGVVSNVSREQDAQGKIVRRSTLELVDYGFDKKMSRKQRSSRRPK